MRNPAIGTFWPSCFRLCLTVIFFAESGGKVLEAGCGNGILSRRVSEAFPKSTVHGVDISEDAIKIAQNVASEQKLSNVSYSIEDLSALPSDMSGTYDFAYSHFVIHDVPRASMALKEIFRVLKPGIFPPCFYLKHCKMNS